MALTGQNHGVYGSKVWHFWVVTHGVLATPDYKTFATRDNGQQTTDYETFASQDYKSTRLRDNEWGGCRWGFAGITESRIDGIMELRIGRVGSKLSHSLYSSILTVHY